MADALIPLPHRSRGEGDPPLVLIHGFGADRLTFSALVGPLAKLRRTIALDLPGHGAAAGWPQTPDATICANAVAATLDALGIARAVLVGHSLGGAVAGIVGLLRPDLVERLVLIAPGGFGREMNVPLLRRYAAMSTAEEAAAVLAEFFGPEQEVPDAMPRLAAEQRADPAFRASLGAIVDRIAKGDGQGMLPLAKLAAAPFPMTLIWGLEDRVLPAAQAIAAPAVFARHLLPGIGHMPHLEDPALVVRLVAHALGIRDAPVETA